MKTKVTFAFNSIDSLNEFDREIYVRENYYKKQWAIPTIEKISDDRYEIEYCIGRKAAKNLERRNNTFYIFTMLFLKNNKVGSLA